MPPCLHSPVANPAAVTLAASMSASVQLCVTRGARSFAAPFVFRVMLLSSKQRKVGGSCVNIQGFPGEVYRERYSRIPDVSSEIYFLIIIFSLVIIGGSGCSDRKHQKTIGSCCFDVS